MENSSMKYGDLQTVKVGDADHQGFPITVHNPRKVAILRLPTSAEMIARIDSQKSIQKSLGLGKSISEPVPNPEADLRLFGQIRVAGADFDEFEARNAISKLTEVDVLESVRDGDRYTITLKTPFCKTVHHLKIPTDKALHFYRRSIVASTSMRHGIEELKYRASAGIDLYDSAVIDFEGYAEGTEVPAHHKFCVAGDLSESCKEFDPFDFDPNS